MVKSISEDSNQDSDLVQKPSSAWWIKGVDPAKEKPKQRHSYHPGKDAIVKACPVWLQDIFSE